MYIKFIDMRQKREVGVAGGFINQMMGNNSTLPVVGEGATQLGHSDRYPRQVVEVSKDFKRVKLEKYSARHNPGTQGGQGHQNWLLEPTGNFMTVVWKWGSWKIETKMVRFVKDFQGLLDEDQKKSVYGEEYYPQNVVEGITEKYTEYSKISILFGQMENYYDWLV